MVISADDCSPTGDTFGVNPDGTEVAGSPRMETIQQDCIQSI